MKITLQIEAQEVEGGFAPKMTVIKNKGGSMEIDDFVLYAETQESRELALAIAQKNGLEEIEQEYDLSKEDVLVEVIE